MDIIQTEIIELAILSNDYKADKKAEHEYRIKYIKDCIFFLDNFVNKVADKKNITQKEFLDFKTLYIGEKLSKQLDRNNIKRLFTDLYNISDIGIFPTDISMIPPIQNVTPNIPPKLSNQSITKGMVGICLKGMQNPHDGSFNRCWFNTFTQAMFSIPELRHVFLKINLDKPLQSFLFKTSITKLKEYNKILENEVTFTQYYDEKENKRINDYKGYIYKIIEMKDNIQPLKIFKEVLLLLSNTSNLSPINIHTYHIGSQTYLEHLYEKMAPGSQIGNTFDSTEIFTKFINMLDNEIPELLGLFNIFTVNIITSQICTENSFRSDKTDVKPIIQLFRSSNISPSIQNSLNELQQIKKSDANEWNRCIKPYDLKYYNEKVTIQITQNTRYLFITLANYIRDDYARQTKVQSTYIDASIIVDGITFNLFGVVNYPNANHYVYHLFPGDGTRKLVKEYNDQSVNDTTYYNMDDIAYMVIYVRA
jgi:hypothetical protein